MNIDLTHESKINPEKEVVSVENIKLKQIIKENAEKVFAWKLQEKKLMYLIYLGIENGYPLDQIYENKVALISTERFRRLLESEENVSKSYYFLWL